MGRKKVIDQMAEIVNEKKFKSFQSIISKLGTYNVKPFKMIIAIDFSNSNNFTGYPNIPDSLHGK